jgi:hypothetical protein
MCRPILPSDNKRGMPKFLASTTVRAAVWELAVPVEFGKPATVKAFHHKLERDGFMKSGENTT